MGSRKRILPPGWYPASAEDCIREIDGFLKEFVAPEGSWMGGVVPHAGWYFSGRAAAKVMSSIAKAARPDRVVIYGGHLSGVGDPVIYTEDAWETPFGPQSLDSALSKEIVSSGEAVRASAGYADNTVEVQLPMVRRFFPEASVIAVHAPASKRAVQLGNAVAALLQEKGLKAIYIGSADLTHYGPSYGFTPKGTGADSVRWVKEENDKALIDKALALDTEALLRDAHQKQNTCSAGPIASVMASVSRYGVKAGKLIEYYTSYDIMPNSSFVGYAAIVY